MALEELDLPAPGSAAELRLTATGVPDSARARLATVGIELIEHAEGEHTAVHAELVSTRLPAAEIAAVAVRLAATPHTVVVLAHTGGERTAAELIAAGASALVGEGNEEALLGLVDHDRVPTALLSSFERRFGDLGHGTGRGTDPSTGLTDRRGFERRIGALGDHDETPRVATMRITSELWSHALASPIVTLQRRRLAAMLAHVAMAARSELYHLGPNEFGLVGNHLSPEAMEHLGDRLVTVAATFRDRGLPLRLVIGHAGAESSTDVEELVDLSRRALDVATMDHARSVLGAEQLALGVSVTTELEASLRLVVDVEAHMVEGVGHGERVGRIAAELARSCGWSPAAVARIQLAGHLHDVGRARLPREAVAGPDELQGELLEAWRTFPVLGAQMLRLSAGSVVADTVHAQCEHVDGQGFPDGRRGTEIPEGARLLAVAHAVEELLLATPHAADAELSARLRERAGTQLEPELVDEATAVLGTLRQGAARTSG